VTIPPTSCKALLHSQLYERALSVFVSVFAVTNTIIDTSVAD
jgi:hypothetical protein